MFTFIIALGALALIAIVYLSIFRAEGLLAFYLLGVSLLLLVVGLLGIPWGTALTGAAFPILFFPCVLWWILSKEDPDEPRLPRHFSLPVVLILVLTVFWQLKHLYERQYLSPRNAYEYYKWMYMIARWAAPFLLGVLFPMTLKRFRRFLLASTVLAIAIALVVLVSYFAGRRDLSASYGARYTPVERLGPLGISIYCGVGGACVMAYLLLKHRLHERMFFAGVGGWMIVALVVSAILLSGSRGPFVSIVLTSFVFLLLFGGRGAVRLGIGLTVAGVLLMFVWAYLPAGPLQHIFGEGMITGKAGLGLRWRLFVSSFNILDEHMFTGQTLELAGIIGIEYSHQVITQVMVETGLLGLAMFLVALVPTVVKWLVAASRRTRDVGVFAGPMAVLLAFTLIQRNIAGELSSLDFWLIMGMLMGHRLRVEYGYGPQELPEHADFEYDQALQPLGAGASV